MQTFTEYFKLQALRDRLPFDIDLDMPPVTSENTVEIEGLKFAILEDLTSRESWFFESVESIQSGQLNDLTLLLRSLVKSLKDACNLPSLEEAEKQFFKPSKKLLKDPEYEKFCEKYFAEIEKLSEAARVTQSNDAVNWLRVTFFILSRCTSDWSIGKTASLTNRTIQEILALIAKEANGGVEPVVEEKTIEPVESEGNDLDKTGVKSTGS